MLRYLCDLAAAKLVLHSTAPRGTFRGSKYGCLDVHAGGWASRSHRRRLDVPTSGHQIWMLWHLDLCMSLMNFYTQVVLGRGFITSHKPPVQVDCEISYYYTHRLQSPARHCQSWCSDLLNSAPHVIQMTCCFCNTSFIVLTTALRQSKVLRHLRANTTYQLLYNTINSVVVCQFNVLPRLRPLDCASTVCRRALRMFMSAMAAPSRASACVGMSDHTGRNRLPDPDPSNVLICRWFASNV